MYKPGLKYSLICLGSGLAIWYGGAQFFPDKTPGNLIEEMREDGILETILHDTKTRSFPFGLISRPLTYTGLAGLVVFSLIPNKKKV